MGSIQLNTVSKSFGAVNVINGVDLDIKNGEFAVFVGPSGCGKSTLLRLVAGLEDVTSGQVLIDGKDVTNVGPSKRGLAMVFQSYALYPHMSVRGNIAFALKMAGEKTDVIEQKVRKAAATLNLTDYLDRKPRQLSGGQRQRVAIGRAIVREPKAFLFDEPLSNLDAALRVQMHDQVEAMTMADKIVVLDRGSVAQVGTPLELYNRPNGLFVAGFIGSPTMNMIKGAPAEKRGAATIGIRPEHADISTTAGEWPAKVRLAEHLGSDTFVHADADGIGPLTLRLEGEAPLKADQRIFVTPREAHLHKFDKEGRRIN
jgi:multiple sugar transport system ATP-binding protein